MNQINHINSADRNSELPSMDSKTEHRLSRALIKPIMATSNRSNSSNMILLIRIRQLNLGQRFLLRNGKRATLMGVKAL